MLPSPDGQRGRPFRNHRQVVEGIAYRYRIHAVLLTQADAAGEIDWTVSVDSTIAVRRAGAGRNQQHITKRLAMTRHS